MTWTHVDDGSVCLADRAGAVTDDGTDWCLAHDRKVANAAPRCWMCGATPGQYHAKACSVDGLMPGAEPAPDRATTMNRLSGNPAMTPHRYVWGAADRPELRCPGNDGTLPCHLILNHTGGCHG